LLGFGDEGTEAFASLLKDERISVRAMAASCFSPYRTEEALPILREAASCKGITGLGAAMTLKRLEAGDTGWQH
jgi:HEAT repeat protein